MAYLGPVVFALVLFFAHLGMSQNRDLKVERVDLSSTAEAIESLAKKPWTKLDQDKIRDIWPINRNSACECQSCTTLTESMAAIDSSCKLCEIVPYLAYDSWSNPEARLAEIGVFVCPQRLDSALTTTQTLIDAVGPPGGALLFGDPTWSVDDRMEHRWQSYRWNDKAGPVSLEVHLYDSNGRWGVHLRLMECPTPETTELLTVDMQRKIPVLSIETDDPCCIRVHYFTKCHFMDACCMESEILDLWPILLEKAEKSDKRQVDFNPRDCTGGGTGYWFIKGSDGEWSTNSLCRERGRK